jgi:hypothetical protein
MAPELLIMGTEQRLKKLSKRTLALSLRQMENENTKIEHLCLEKIAAEHDKNKAEENAALWAFLRDIGSVVTALFTLILGASVAGTAAGTLLTASATLSLLSTVITHLGGWDWLADLLAAENEEGKAMLATLLPMIVALISIACSMAGMAQLAEFQAVEQVLGQIDRAIQFVKGGVNCGSALGTFAKGSAEGRVIEVDGALALSEKKVDLLTRVFEDMMQEFNRVSSKVKKMVKQSIYESRAITQG